MIKIGMTVLIIIILMIKIGMTVMITIILMIKIKIKTIFKLQGRRKWKEPERTGGKNSKNK